MSRIDQVRTGPVAHTGCVLRHRPHLLDPGHWQGRGRFPRVVVEHPDAAVRWAYSGILREAGYETRSCSGPGEGARCPLVETGCCPLVEGADVVVTSVDLGDDIVRALAARAWPAMVVEVPGQEAGRYRLLAPSATLVSMPVTGEVLREAVAVACAAVAA